MTNPGIESAPRRRRFYVDGRLQGRLAVALVVLEVGLFGAACAYLYFALAGIIDDNLYVIHAAEREDLLPQMLHELGWVTLMCAGVNSAALLFTHGLWARHVARVLGALHERMERVRALDLRADRSPPGEGQAHRLLDVCDRWTAAERERVVAVERALAQLPRSPHDGESARAALAALDEAAAALRRGRRRAAARPD